MELAAKKINTLTKPFRWAFGLVILYSIIEIMINGFGYAFAYSIVLLIAIYCIMRGSKEPRIINPYYLFSLVPLSLLLYDPSISSIYFIKLKLSTVWLAIINMVAFLFAVSKTPKYKAPKDNFLNSTKSLLLNGWLLMVISLVGTTIQPLQSVLSLLTIPALACALKSKKWLHFFAMFFIWIALNMNNLNKTMILSILILLFLGYFRYRRSVESISMKMVLGLVVGLFIMYISFGMKSYLSNGGSFVDFFNGDWLQGTAGMSDYYIKSDLVKWKLPPALFMPYMYFTTAWGNLQYVINYTSEFSHGLWFFKPLLSWLQIDESFGYSFSLQANSSFNTFTFIAVEYVDFGFWGSMFASAFLGYFVKRIYDDFCNSTSPLVLGCYVLVAQAAAEMFFSNHFFMQSYPFTVVFLCFIYRYFAKLFIRK